MTTLNAPAPAGYRMPRTFVNRRALARRLATDAALIAVGATSAFQVLGFTATLLTVVCLVLVPAVLLIRLTLIQAVPMILATVGFVAFFVSSQINALPITDQRVLQWAGFGVYYLGVLVVTGTELERVFSVLAGIAVGTILYTQSAGLPFSALAGFADQWKYALAPWVTIIVLYVMAQLNTAVPLQASALVTIAVVSLLENYRSHAVVCLGAAAVLTIGWLAAGRMSRWLQLGLVAGFGALLYTLIPAIAMSGIAGDAIQRKTAAQLDSGVPTILAGRTESPLSIAAILDRPWFGWGSADFISPEVFDRAKSIAISLGFNPNMPIEASWYLSNGRVSLHSVLLTAWAEGGVLAALLPLGLLAAAIAIIWTAPSFGLWQGLAVVVSVQAIWDLLFSPTSYNLLPTFALLALIWVARWSQHTESPPIPKVCS